MRTLLDINPNNSERKTALVARELQRQRIDIAALQETRFAGESQLEEVGGGYTFYWKGLEEGQPRRHGVGFAIKTNLIRKLTALPKGINERLISLRIMIGRDRYATLISAYAPTMDAEDEVKETFYSELDGLLSSVAEDDKLILLGDFNARVGTDHGVWENVLGRHGVGKMNSNGMLLLTKCAEHRLIITNTLFRQPNRRKTSWMHPRSKHWHLIDFIITKQRDRKDVLITRSAICSEDNWTDHRLILTRLKMKILPKRRNPNEPKRLKFNTDRLKNSHDSMMFERSLRDKLPHSFPQPMNDHWNSLKSAITDTCNEFLGLKQRKHQDWFDENDNDINKVTADARKALREYLKDPRNEAKKKRHRELKAQVQVRTRALKNQWWVNKSREIQSLADSNNTRGFFRETRAVFGPSHQGPAPLRSKDGNALLRDQNDINARWKEHFSELLNRESDPDFGVINELPEYPIQDSLGAIPSFEEVKAAICSLKNNKASGPDNIPAEVLKSGGALIRLHIHQLITKLWVNDAVPDDLKNGTIVTVFKKKGDKSDCGNYRGITLLSVVGKVVTHILNKRLIPLAEDILPESQSGFRPSRGTADMIFCARQLQEKCVEQNKPLYIAFIDLAKAFDSVNRDLLWLVLQKFGCPEKFIRILRLFHDNMEATVTANGCTSEPFAIKSGVKQGCVIAPTLFSVFVSAVLHIVRNALPPGIQLTYRYDGNIFNISRFKAKTKTNVTSILELQYADDNAVCAIREEDLQATVVAFDVAYRRLGLTINARKTQILYQPKPGDDTPVPPSIQLGGVSLENVNHFPYLGSHLSSAANIDVEINHRVKSAAAAFGKLRKRVFDDHDLRKSTKLMVYKAVVLPTLTYGCETWTAYRRHIKGLEKFHQRCLRSILRITWKDRRTNISVLEESNCSSIESLLIRNQLRWSGHLVRMDDARLPKKIFYSQLSQGKRKVGAPMKRFKDILKQNLKSCDINPNTWETKAKRRDEWRLMCKEGIQYFEDQRTDHLEQRRTRRHEQRRQGAAPAAEGAGNFVCPICGKVCRSRIGLHSHRRTHRNNPRETQNS